MTETEARSVIVEALHKTANVFNNPSISDRLKDPAGEVTIEELGIDSLDRVEWCIEIESQTGVDIDPAELASVETLSGFARLLNAQMADRG